LEVGVNIHSLLPVSTRVGMQEIVILMRLVKMQRWKTERSIPLKS
jgi:hypothetical protein